MFPIEWSMWIAGGVMLLIYLLLQLYGWIRDRGSKRGENVPN